MRGGAIFGAVGRDIGIDGARGGGGIYCTVNLMLSGSRLFSNISPSVYNNEEPLNNNDTVHILYSNIL